MNDAIISANGKKNGVYFFVIEGEVQLEGQSLKTRDAAGLWGQSSYEVIAEQDAFVLAIDLPLQLPKMG